MFAAGVPLDRSLHLLGDQTDDKKIAAVARDISEKISGGVPLYLAFEQQKDVFSKLQMAMLRVGERTGELETVLFRLADYEEKRRGITMKVRSALTYPAFLLLITSFMLIVLPPYMFQGLFAMLESQKMELPLITKVVLALSNFVRGPLFWLLVILVVAAGAALLPQLLKNKSFQLQLARLIGQTPVLGRLSVVLASTRFARALEIQLAVGEGPLQSLSIAAMASSNPVLEDAIGEATEALKSGATLVDSLEATQFFHPTFLSMLRAGEESAELPDIIARTASMYEEELDYAMETFTDLLEPMIMLFMGVLVGVGVMATMLPMVKMLQNL